MLIHNKQRDTLSWTGTNSTWRSALYKVTLINFQAGLGAQSSGAKEERVISYNVLQVFDQKAKTITLRASSQKIRTKANWYIP